MEENQKENINKEFTQEQLEENQAKLEEYERIFKVIVVAVVLMFAVIVCIVFGLIINGT